MGICVTIDGFLAPYASVVMINCTVTDNGAVGEGDGVYVRADTQPILTIKSSIIWNNNPLKSDTNAIANIRERGNTTLRISYSDYDRVRSSGDGIVDVGGQLTADPLFANTTNGDFHLKSEFGRTTPSGNVVYDPVTSPCVDAGDPADPCEDEPQSDPCRIDMGGYGGTSEASGNLGGIPAGLLFIVK